MDDKLKNLAEESKLSFQKNRFAEAATGFEKCLTMMAESGDALELAEMRNNLCVALVRLKKFPAALEAVKGTDLVFAKAGDQKKQGIALANLGTVYEGLLLYEDAMVAYDQASECFKTCHENKLRSITLRSLSDIQMKTGKRYQAIATLQNSYQQDSEKKLKSRFFAKLLQQLTDKLTGK